eukprot:jgi/Botrbrau1/16936/Bobra.49_2s0005.1
MALMLGLLGGILWPACHTFHICWTQLATNMIRLVYACLSLISQHPYVCMFGPPHEFYMPKLVPVHNITCIEHSA